ncbi:hypothetical protein F5146DRAFT_1044007 [Armillaria mellea]|nr:hypothetical protein F5146DRAFT_1044007 [Armillaria mellea]
MCINYNRLRTLLLPLAVSIVASVEIRRCKSFEREILYADVWHFWSIFVPHLRAQTQKAHDAVYRSVSEPNHSQVDHGILEHSTSDVGTKRERCSMLWRQCDTDPVVT